MRTAAPISTRTGTSPGRDHRALALRGLGRIGLRCGGQLDRDAASSIVRAMARAWVSFMPVEIAMLRDALVADAPGAGFGPRAIDTELLEVGLGGVRFSVLEQVLQDLESTITGFL